MEALLFGAGCRDDVENASQCHIWKFLYDY